MTKIYQYCVAENWGKGFITHTNSIKMSPKGFPGNVWRIATNSQYSNKWVTAVNGVHKTLVEAQAIVAADDPRKIEESMGYIPRPTDITLEE